MTAPATDQMRPSTLSTKDFAVALAVVLPLAAIIAPYRSIHVPQLFILAIAILGGLWCFKTAVEDVETLLFLFLLYIPFQKVLPGDFGGRMQAANFLNVFLLLLVLGGLTRVVTSGQWKPKPRSWQGRALALFLAITSLSILAEAFRRTGEMRYETLSDLKRWLTPFAIYFLVTALARSTATVKKMFLATVVTTAVIGLLGVKQFWMDMGGGSRHNIEGIRIAVTSGPSNLGALFAYYLPYILALWLSNFWRMSYWALLFPLAWCLDSLRTTFSRGAALAFVAAALVVVWKKSKAVFVLIAILAGVLAMSGEMRLPHSIFGRMTTVYVAERPGDALPDKLDKSSRTRLVIWGGALEMIRDYPILGVGYGRFPDEIGKYRPEVAGMDPHNNFLKIGTEMGVPALASFALVLLVCLWRAWKYYGRVTDPLLKAILLGYCGSVIGVLVANMFGSRLDSAEITTQFWALSGGIVVIERWQDHKAAEDAERESWRAGEQGERRVEL